MEQEHGEIFSARVDHVKLQLHDYLDVIKRPMDLGTVKRNLEQKVYRTFEQFAADVNLVWSNAMKYNPVRGRGGSAMTSWSAYIKSLSNAR